MPYAFRLSRPPPAVPHAATRMSGFAESYRHFGRSVRFRRGNNSSEGTSQVAAKGKERAMARLLASAQQNESNLGFNVNLWWGMVMVVSRCVILGLSLASPRRRAARQSQNRA